MSSSDLQVQQGCAGAAPVNNNSSDRPPPPQIQARSTERHDNSAERLWKIVRKNNGQPVSISKAELAGRGAEHLCNEFALFVLAQPIPLKFDDNLNPTTNTSRACVGTTLVGYLGKYFKEMRRVDPDHPDWKDLIRNDTFPRWYTALRSSMEERAASNQITWQGAYEWGVTGKRPLYIDLGATKGDNPLKFCDLKYVVTSLFTNANHNNENVAMAAKIVSTADAVARGGEVKFQKYTEWDFDFNSRVLDTKWNEPKTANTYGMARIPDARWWFDFYCIMGAYAMVANGLYRSPKHKMDGLESAVFPDLHNIGDSSVTSQLGRVIQENLPPEVMEDPELKKLFSAKSLRSGGVNTLALDHILNIFMVCARSGHSLKSRVGEYLDSSNPLLGLPAALSIHGRRINATVVLPDLNAVGTANLESILKLVGTMFSTSLPEFQDNTSQGGRKGKLWDVTKCFAASLIMHHREMLDDCGSENHVSCQLLRCAVEAKITYAGKPELHPEEVLLKYCDDIRGKFDRDVLVSDTNARGETNESLGLQMMSKIMEDLNEMKSNNKNLADDAAATKATIAHLTEQKRMVENNLEETRRALDRTRAELQEAILSNQRKEARLQHYAMLSTMSSPIADPNRAVGEKRPLTGGDVHRDLSGALIAASSRPAGVPSSPPPSSTCPPVVSSPRAASTAMAPVSSRRFASAVPVSSTTAAASTALVPAELPTDTRHGPTKKSRRSVLVNSDKSRKVNEGDSDKGVKLSSALTDIALSESGLFKGLAKLENIPSIPPTIISRTNASKMKACLALVDFSGDPSDIDILRNAKDSERAAVQDAATRLTIKAEDKLYEFEGMTREIAAAQGKRRSEAVTGLAKKISEYRTKIKDVTRDPSKLGKIALIEYAKYMELKKKKEAPPNGEGALDKLFAKQRSSTSDSS